MPAYKTMMIREGFNEEELCLNLDLLTEIREIAAIREASYKTKLKQYYNKKVHLPVSSQGNSCSEGMKQAGLKTKGN
ncbi:hypothetical protein Tco_0311157 [Tanacetum coccineum]